MNILGKSIASHILRTGSFTSLSSFNKDYLPVAPGPINDDFIAPAPQFMTSEQATMFASALQLHNMQGLSKWISLIALLRKHHQFPHLMGSYNSILRFVRSKLGLINLATWNIPFPEFRNTPHSGIICEVRDVSFAELMTILNTPFVYEAFEVIIQIALFGFPLLPNVLSGLHVEELGDYIRSRLLHGRLDKFLAQVFRLKGSSMLPQSVQLQSSEIDDSLKVLYMNRSAPQKRFKMMLNNVNSRVNSLYFLGGNTEMVETLRANHLLKFGNDYTHYLQNSPNNNKLGPKGYQTVFKEGLHRENPFFINKLERKVRKAIHRRDDIDYQFMFKTLQRKHLAARGIRVNGYEGGNAMDVDDNPAVYDDHGIPYPPMFFG